jgi:hypothetical protein
VKELTGVHISTIQYLEYSQRRPQTATLDKLLNLYAMRIKKLEHYDQLWGEDGKQPIQHPTTRSLQSLRVDQRECEIPPQSQSKGTIKAIVENARRGL